MAQRWERFGRSQLTVAHFCESEGISVPSLYQWRKRLAGRGQRPARRKLRTPVAGPSAPAFKPVWLAAVGQPAVATIRLPGGIVVELGSDVQTIERVIGQVLMHQATSGGDPC